MVPMVPMVPVWLRSRPAWLGRRSAHPRPRPPTPTYRRLPQASRRARQGPAEGIVAISPTPAGRWIWHSFPFAVMVFNSRLLASGDT